MLPAVVARPAVAAQAVVVARTMSAVAARAVAVLVRLEPRGRSSRRCSRGCLELVGVKFDGRRRVGGETSWPAGALSAIAGNEVSPAKLEDGGHGLVCGSASGAIAERVGLGWVGSRKGEARRSKGAVAAESHGQGLGQRKSPVPEDRLRRGVGRREKEGVGKPGHGRRRPGSGETIVQKTERWMGPEEGRL
jgi:hypothetical protein